MLDPMADFVRDLDLSQDEFWRPTWNPYTGDIEPMWKITAEARWRMGEWDKAKWGKQ
jgi:hypothetical protein